ncbi:hypothetical protein FIBSPDRAFT_849882 [Athelia psychrophila]|uniref:Fungal-type protein kinase domain-containing protein n=1 Tax=Athelia psychrophila TaxID=1759441 RepID=A0A166U779_9AGAM|nr:hypothetical protein FIBSPDRAFT_849882 [Fibularhizoctonia sp. CBS 109695]
MYAFHLTWHPQSLTLLSVSMPFSTDTTWPAGLVTIFNICRQELQPFENRYYAPYNTLLTYCFGPDLFEFFVAPPPPLCEFPPRDTVKTTVFLIVFDARRRPVLIAEIEEDAWTSRPDTRFEADRQMRQRYDSLLAGCPLPRMWGLSLLGTSLRVYRGDAVTGGLEPLFEDRPSRSRTLPRNFLEGAWNIDVLSQEGFAKMKEIVGDVIGSAGVLDRA